jgi:hypothetical protein
MPQVAFVHVALPLVVAPHVVPAHPPQCCGELTRLAHVPEQLVSGNAQTEAQPVLVQTWFAPHGVVHAPHDPGSVRSVSQPSLAVPLQSPQPGWHEAMAQAPFASHFATALGSAQASTVHVVHPQ